MREAVLRTHRDGPLEVGEVWARYADPRRWTEWSPHLRSLRLDPGSAHLFPGLSGTVRGPLGISARFVVTAVDERSRTWSWTVHPAWAPVEVQMLHTVDPMPWGTRAGIELRGPWPVVRAYRPVSRWALGHLLRPG